MADIGEDIRKLRAAYSQAMRSQHSVGVPPCSIIDIAIQDGLQQWACRKEDKGDI